ncbi:WNT1-inducible-signaling pathway protein 1 isoform X2 [Heterocephalus glaber]|uniref:CCN family member 4 n=1 Tax=Heterocephalus glaber TaxID=10181 RepID=A0AAX6SDG0_HETGA|nr:WNT1-inducible-signaling pathway protein 1 isoform X2 [Heterocephalus glaber]
MSSLCHSHSNTCSKDGAATSQHRYPRSLSPERRPCGFWCPGLFTCLPSLEREPSGQACVSTRLCAEDTLGNKLPGCLAWMLSLQGCLTKRWVLPMFAEVVGVGCVLDGVRYSNGESFQPSCRYNCTCIGGAVGCTPLCLRARPPRLWCHQPRRVRVPGQCCEQWVCEDDARRPRQTVLGDTAALAAVSDVEPWHGNCLPYTSPWSPCSTSCGLGISTRVSNANAQCWPEQESRLCNLRPCDVDIRPHIKEGKKCLAVFQPEAPMNFTLAGCVSTRTYRPKYCGVCMDNRCCIPYKSKTIEVSFQCPEGPGFSRKVLWINACFCNLTCRNPNDIFADLELYPEISEIAN